MKAYISVDIEGVVGVLNQYHTTRDGDDFAAARLRMTREASAAVAGCIDAGAARVIVNDSHGTMSNLVLEEMHPAAEVVYGNTKLLCMMEGIDEECEAAMFVGYHTAAGIAGTLSHTMAGGLFYSVRLNGKPCSEFDINAAIAGEFGVPSVLVTGDDLLIDWLGENYPKIHGLAVKEYRGRNCSIAPHPSVAQERIRGAAAEALAARKKIKPVRVKNPVFEIDLFNEIAAEYCSLIPTVEQIGPRTIRYKSANIIDAYHVMLVILRTARL